MNQIFILFQHSMNINICFQYEHTVFISLCGCPFILVMCDSKHNFLSIEKKLLEVYYLKFSHTHLLEYILRSMCHVLLHVCTVSRMRSMSLSGVGAASALSDSQHMRQPPVTSSALTWHVETLLKAPWHQPSLAHLSLDAYDAHN